MRHKGTLLYIMLMSLSLFLSIRDVHASHAAIWCNPENSMIEDGKTRRTGYRTLWKAIQQMAPGDTIIIAKGDWRKKPGMSITGVNGGVYLPVSGSGLDKMSTVRAESDWEVLLPELSDQGVGRKYVKLRGLVFYKSTILYAWNYSKIIRCGFRGEKNNTAFALSSCKHSLVEECVSWGGGRYKFLNYRGDYNVFRRCLGRHDWFIAQTDTACQEGVFRGYGCSNSAWQNCIAIDSDRIEYQTPTGLSYEDGDFWIGDQTGAGGNVVEGCIVLKGMYQSYYLAGPRGEGNKNKVKVKNSVAIGPSLEGMRGLTGAITYGDITATVENCAFINFTKGNQHFISHNKASGSLKLINSIARDVGRMKGVSGDFNYFYNVKTSKYSGSSMNMDPLTNGFLYPCRVEAGSKLSKVGKNGSRCGPEILKKIGVSGALHGSPGWDKTTDENLWPFPNETKIRKLMMESVEGVAGIYGFCVEGQTLTNYIWGCFGNTVPPFNIEATIGDGEHPDNMGSTSSAHLTQHCWL